MQSAEIARRFLAHFEARGHAIVPSASLVADDPTLLFVVAGMQPFKPYLLGQQTPPWKRVADVQKVVRTLDIEEVGKTTRHATFFQMLGNWSFGDYFKEDAIRWAWELLTKPERDGGFGFPEEKLWATVLHGDDESYAIWRDQIGVPESRIQRRGLKDNYWHMGVPGPGGPCSEIYYDRGPEYGREGGPEADEDRYLEVWNLVFMQDMLSEVRAKDDFDVEAPLPFKNVDTGMGLERMASILQGVDNIYEIDTTYKILEKAAELTEQEYGRDQRNDVALRVVADHVRTAVMLIEDGVLPSNEGGGYVLRRLLRRSIRNLRLLSGAQRGGGASATTGFMHELTAVTIDVMGDQFPELRRDATHIHTVIDAEEAAFAGHAAHRHRDLRRRGRGDQAQARHACCPARRRSSSTTPTASRSTSPWRWRPSRACTVDEEGFRRLMGEQRDRAKKDAREKKTGNADISVYASLLEQAGKVTFTGYDAADGEATIVGLLADGVPVQSAAPGQRGRGRPGPDPVLRRGRRPAGRPRRDQDQRARRQRRGRGDRRADAAARPDRAPRHGPPRRDHHRLARVGGDRRRAAPGDVPQPHRDPPGAPRAARRARRVGGAGGLGERARAAPVRLHRDRRGAADGAARGRGRGEPGPHRRPVGARLPHLDRRGARDGRARAVRREATAARSASSRSASTHASCAAAPTWPGPASSAWSSCSARRRSAPACAASRPWWASTRSASSPGRACSSTSSATSSRPARRSCRSGSRTWSPGSATRSASWPRSSPRSCSRRPGRSRRRAENVDGIAFVAHRVPDGTDADSIRRLALDIRSKVPALQPAVVALIGTPADRPVVVIAVNEAGAGPACPRARWSAARPRRSAAAAAASPTSRRAAARPVPDLLR